MPYFVYRVMPFAQLQKLAEFAVFREASTHAKALRAAQGSAPGKIKVMFAADERMAEDLLCQIREPGPTGEDG
jgi:hypothetical protein